MIQYHYHAQGYLAHYPDLLVQLPDLPAALNMFTNKGAALAYTSDLHTHLAEVRYLYGQGDLTMMIHEQSIVDVTRPAGSHLKAALPSTYNGTSSKAQTFLTECWTFMHLNWTSFPDDQVKILWVLQLCSDKAANWKRIQMELLEMGVSVPNHLLDWCNDIAILLLFFLLFYFPIPLRSTVSTTLHSITNPQSTNFPVFC